MTMNLIRTSSAVFDTCLLISGKIDGYITTDVKPWDVAAGLLFAEELGFAVTNLRGEP